MAKPPLHLVILAAASCFVLMQGFSYVRSEIPAVGPTSPGTSSAPTGSRKALPHHFVAALGRLEPAGEVVHVCASGRTDTKVRRVLVREGDTVRANQPIAFLNSDQIDHAAVLSAKRDIELSCARLAQLKAPPKAANLSAQDAQIARLSEEAEKAKADAARYEYLFHEGAVSEIAYEDFRTKARTKLKEVEGARSNREAMIEVRKADIEVLEGEIATAQARLARASAEYENDIVRAPISGTVLFVHTRSGEHESSSGICELGAVSQMYAKADVCESDIGAVKLGQRVVITGESLRRPIQGSVARIGSEVVEQRIMSTDAAADVDRRVVQVRVRIDAKDVSECRALTNAIVEARFL